LRRGRRPLHPPGGAEGRTLAHPPVARRRTGQARVGGPMPAGPWLASVDRDLAFGRQSTSPRRERARRKAIVAATRWTRVSGCQITTNSLVAAATHRAAGRVCNRAMHGPAGLPSVRAAIHWAQLRGASRRLHAGWGPGLRLPTTSRTIAMYLRLVRYRGRCVGSLDE
jgi:hypothetical protein